MGFFSGLKSLVGSVSASISDEVSKFQKSDSVDALLAVMSLSAGADGSIEKSEKDAAANFVRSGDLFKSFDRVKLSRKLEEYYSKSTDSIASEDLYDVIAKVAGTPDAERVMRVGIGICNRDGSFDQSEKDVMRRVAQTLGLTPANYGI
jgi:tellurite resistance protein TerB